MGTVVHIVLAVLCFLIAIGCLFRKVDNPPATRAPDALDRAAYQLIFRRIRLRPSRGAAAARV